MNNDKYQCSKKKISIGIILQNYWLTFPKNMTSIKVKPELNAIQLQV